MDPTNEGPCRHGGPKKQGGFVLFSVVSNMKTERAKTITREERLDDFRKAALVVVNE